MNRIVPMLVLSSLALAACGSAHLRQSAQNPQIVEGGAPVQELVPQAQAQPASAPPSDAAANVQDTGSTASGTSAAASQRLVIKTAQLAIVVADVNARMKIIHDLAVKDGGYEVSSSVYQSYANNNVLVPQGQIVIRVDENQLDAALAEIKSGVVEVQSESQTGTDVTAQYTDQQSQLRSLEAAEAQLEDIMKQATKTEDVINVFNQLTSYRQQIEIVKGQIKYYEESAALSEITVQVIAKETIQPIQIAGWEPQGVARDAVQNLIYFYQDFVDFLITFFIYTLPVLITIGLPLYLIFIGVRALFRRMRAARKQEPMQPAVPEDKKKKK